MWICIICKNNNIIVLQPFQIKCLNVSAVVAIQTQGRANDNRWVVTYRVEYSQDCATFNRVLDADGNNRVRKPDLLNSSSKSTYDISSVFQSV